MFFFLFFGQLSLKLVSIAPFSTRVPLDSEQIFIDYEVIFRYIFMYFKIGFRAWLLQTAATFLLNRDGRSCRAESTTSARRSRERKNRGTKTASCCNLPMLASAVCVSVCLSLSPFLPPGSQQMLSIKSFNWFLPR